MTEQISFGELFKAEGMAQVRGRTDPMWKLGFNTAAQYILERQGSVTSEEVVRQIGIPAHIHPNAIGATMHGFAKRLKLRCEYEKSSRPSRHAAVVGRWFKSS